MNKREKEEEERIKKNNEIKTAKEWKESHPKIDIPPIELFDQFGPELLEHQYSILTVFSKYGKNQASIQKGKSFVSEAQLINIFGTDDEYIHSITTGTTPSPTNTYFPVFDTVANCEVDQEDYLWSRKTLKRYKVYLIKNGH